MACVLSTEISVSLWFFILFALVLGSEAQYKQSVKVYHYLTPRWGNPTSGLQECGEISCEWSVSDQLSVLSEQLFQQDEHASVSSQLKSTTVSVYNIIKPNQCKLNTDYTIAESEESRTRYGTLFDDAFPHYTGYSTTNTAATIQRTYIIARNYSENDLIPSIPHTKLLKAASYVASDCHKKDNANLNRDGVVKQIRAAGFRVDGLGRCMHSIGPGGVPLTKSRHDMAENLKTKRQVTGRYLFNLAFENSFEPGYVTEKPFDALIAGTVPVYLGDAEHLKALLPHPKAAIFVADYPNIASLVQYLQYLSRNETAYEEHRSWRTEFRQVSFIKSHPILGTSWHCKICQWAVKQKQQSQQQQQSWKVEFSGSQKSTFKANTTVVCANYKPERPYRALKGAKGTYNDSGNSSQQTALPVAQYQMLMLSITVVLVLFAVLIVRYYYPPLFKMCNSERREK